MFSFMQKYSKLYVHKSFCIFVSFSHNTLFCYEMTVKYKDLSQKLQDNGVS